MTLLITGICWLVLGVVFGFALCFAARNNDDGDGGW